MDRDKISNLYEGPSIDYRCFLSNFSSFGWGDSEEKIKMWKINGQQVMVKARTDWQGGVKATYNAQVSNTVEVSLIVNGKLT